MAKESFLVVSLREARTKKLAQVITNETSLKILDFLANREGATETEIAKSLDAPISTIHYNLKALMDARMVKWDEFHYSEKGKEVRHYILANRYILIAPEKEAGLRARFKSILPISVVLIGAAALIQFFSARVQPLAVPAIMSKAVEIGVERAADTSAGMMPTAVAPPSYLSTLLSSLASNITFWFAVGALSALLLYLLFSWLRERQ